VVNQENLRAGVKNNQLEARAPPRATVCPRKKKKKEKRVKAQGYESNTTHGESIVKSLGGTKTTVGNLSNDDCPWLGARSTRLKGEKAQWPGVGQGQWGGL